jgi:hypothetical protein
MGMPVMRHIETEATAFIEVKLPKGCVLVLTAEEYNLGIVRGKAKRRREAFEKRLARADEARRSDAKRGR